MCLHLVTGTVNPSEVSDDLKSDGQMYPFSNASDGWNGSDDPLAAHSPQCSSAGPPWSHQFANHLNAKLINLAVGGAVADQSVISSPALDFRGQTTAFITQVANSNKLSWTTSNSLFMVSFGTSDVNNSFRNSQGNGTDLYVKDIQSYFSTVERLYAAGARNFAFINVIPFDRAQIGIKAGAALQQKLKQNILEFNRLLQIHGSAFCASKSDVKICKVFDSHSVFTEIMNDIKFWGFATADGVCDTYASRTACVVDPTVDSSCLGPIDAYVWKDELHPSFASSKYWAWYMGLELSGIPY